MSDGASPADGAAVGSAAKDKVFEQSNKHKKVVRLLTVMAYLSTVSGTAFMLSLYYLFLWQPKVQLGGKALVADPPPPNTLALFYPEMAPQLAARVASEEAIRRADGAVSREPSNLQRRGSDVGESQVPATPQLTLPAMENPLEVSGKKREARSTVMETTQQTLTTAPTARGVGSRAHLQTQPLQTSTPTPSPPTHQTNPKPGEHPQHTTSHPHPVEIGVHA